MRNIKNMKMSIITYALLFSLLGCLNTARQDNILVLSSKSSGRIYLYGEHHAVEKILEKEIEIWGEFYNDQGLRHLFLELPYYTTELLNIWMNSEDDEIFNRIYDDWNGTANHNPVVKDFFKQVKTRFPETIFHGTDVGHQYQTTGKWYLNYLSQQNEKNSEQYQYTKKAIGQGKHYYSQKQNGAYRENMMTANFVREFNKLDNESIMGIYGSAHTGISATDHSSSVPCMANQLNDIYANQVYSKNLAHITKDIAPIRIDTIHFHGSDYKALYFGRQNLSGFKNFEYRDFWRLEGVYNNLKNAPKTGDVLPYNNYPMKIIKGQVFVIDYMKTDSTSTRKYYRSDGNSWKNRPTTEEFIPGVSDDRTL